jgi:hypothetical protein
MSKLLDWLSKHQKKIDYMILVCALLALISTALSANWVACIWAFVAFSLVLRLIGNENNHIHHNHKSD